MKSLIFSLFLLLTTTNSANTPLAAVSYDSCEYPRVYTNNGIKLGPVYGPSGNVSSATINVLASFKIHLESNNCALQSLTVTFNSEEIYVGSAQGAHIQIELPQKPGAYEVRLSSAEWIFYPFMFYLLPRTVGIDEQSTIEGAVSIFPNPASDVLYISSSEELAEITLIDLYSKALIKEKTNSKEFQIPIGDLPRGIYFVHVATLSNRIAIKKIVVQ